MSSKQESLKICGDCPAFDIKDADGRLVGHTNVLHGGFVTMGICRAGEGIVNDKTICTKPSEMSKQKK